MASERLFNASQEATFALNSIARRVELAHATLKRIEQRAPRGPGGAHLEGFALVVLALEALEHAQQIGRLLCAASAMIAERPKSSYDTPSAAQSLTGAALRCAELAAFVERLAADAEAIEAGRPSIGTAAPKSGIDLLVDEHSSVSVLIARDHAKQATANGAAERLTREARELGCKERGTLDDLSRPCTRCGEPLGLRQFTVPTADGLRHDVCDVGCFCSDVARGARCPKHGGIR